ncbi:hypothetical protein [Streptosporangium sp. NPDC087985]|uniref:hypothetical protein n=1 Tax=Streptosporangium sp. NPDC087985 TaxID=3366196 RepID=UPI003806B166
MSEATEGIQPISFDADDISRIERVLGLRHLHTLKDYVIFEHVDAGGIRKLRPAIPLDSTYEILQAIARGAEKMEEYEGWIDPGKGFAEFEIGQGASSPFTSRNADRFNFENRPCSHTHKGEPPFVHDKDRNFMHPLIRVTSGDSSTCIEISPNSALCTPLLPWDSDSRQVRSQTTLKIFLDGETEKSELLRRSRELANSFIFELNARHGVLYSLRPKWERPSYRRRTTAVSNAVRFPKTPVPDNVATLFSIPNDFAMRGNHTLSYLSYYQILEHYLPIAHRREAVKKVRRLLRSLDFDEEKDSSILQILSSVERSHGASESDQLRTLIEECVPEIRLQEFFSFDYGGHFGKQGPISGVPVIHSKSGESLASQVAKRVYALRNRIVHAKDDVRYAESKVLLPVSYEALRLYPDIELLRVLAIEVIVSNR